MRPWKKKVENNYKKKKCKTNVKLKSLLKKKNACERHARRKAALTMKQNAS